MNIFTIAHISFLYSVQDLWIHIFISFLESSEVSFLSGFMPSVTNDYTKACVWCLIHYRFLIGYEMSRCSCLNFYTLGILLHFAFSYLAFFQIISYWQWSIKRFLFSLHSVVSEGSALFPYLIYTFYYPSSQLIFVTLFIHSSKTQVLIISFVLYLFSIISSTSFLLFFGGCINLVKFICIWT